MKERTREQSKAYNYKRAPEQMAVRRAKKQLKAKRKEDVRTEAGGYNTGAGGIYMKGEVNFSPRDLRARPEGVNSTEPPLQR